MALSDSQILAEVTGIFRDLFEDESLQIGPDFSRQSYAQWDSMNHVNLITAIELKFGIKFGVAEIESAQTVANLIAIIKKKTSRPCALSWSWPACRKHA